MLQNGHYKVDFGASLPGVGGHVKLDDGVITGGDDQYRYEGTYDVVGTQVTARLTISAYAPNAVSVFGTPGGQFSLNLTGQVQPGGFSLTGPSPFGGPGIAITGRHLPTIGLGQI
ncbi:MULTISPECIES: GrlR family regulatory protein [unclassified Burkholderia]|uniref:GrlR family regulatory protein n=1 Tax=unclassified Burkholderia TaxID=2613784 RepID=UPI0007523AB3|nr:MULTISPECIES: GrlR family regulatory protein [unclassified Burkholderia]KVN17935.1 hypothetical protein WT08_02040 [Burkholderia sp. MSMB1552]KWZ55515.1 hypothetical protein WS92_06040 [Burkholderia sp. MSMB1588]